MRLPPRFSIAGLMAVVLVSSLGLAALRSGSATWAGGLHLLTQGILVLAVVGAVCRGPSERAGWLGFALFGFGYLRGGYFFGYLRSKLPTTVLLDVIRPDDVRPLGFMQFAPDDADGYYWVVGHCLWSLLAATIGGGLAHLLFAAPTGSSADLDARPRQENRPARARWRRFAAIGLAGLVTLAALVLVIPRLDLAVWAGAVYLLTWILLGFAALGFACGRGKRRMIWFGAAFFGLGYMVLNRGPEGFEEERSYARLVADELLDGLRPWLPQVESGFPAKTVAVATENARIKKAFNQPLAMQFPDATPLEDVLKYIRTATKTSDGHEIPIYVDPQGLQDADKTMQSTIEIDLKGCPLSTTLPLILQQLSLSYYIRDGLVHITSVQTADFPVGVDYYLLLMHSVLALLVAGLGALLVPLVSERRSGPPA